MKNIFMTIAYDGTDFHGWQRQPGKRTVQGELERVLSEVCGEPITIDGTSRTDAGVHAYGQCATFQGEFAIPADRIKIAANNYLAGSKNRETGDIRITDIKEVPIGFHARFDAKGKEYLYRISVSPEPDVFRKNYTYQIKTPLDADAMRAAAEYIAGKHDFKCFQASGGEEKETTVRTIYALTVTEGNRGSGVTGDENGADSALSGDITIAVSGDGFLYNMVRIIVGTLIEVGLGKRTPESVKDTIESLDRTRAGFTAPAHGLYLNKVFYDENDT